MRSASEYRVINRRKFIIVMIFLLSIVAVAVWISLDHLSLYVEQIQALAENKPVEASETLTQLIHTFAIVNGVVLSLLASLIIWHGWRSWTTSSVPPKGSWILEGQDTWSGEPARRVARFMIIVGVILAILAMVSSLILWRMADTLLR